MFRGKVVSSEKRLARFRKSKSLPVLWWAQAMSGWNQVSISTCGTKESAMFRTGFASGAPDDATRTRKLKSEFVCARFNLQFIASNVYICCFSRVCVCVCVFSHLFPFSLHIFLFVIALHGGVRCGCALLQGTAEREGWRGWNWGLVVLCPYTKLILWNCAHPCPVRESARRQHTIYAYTAMGSVLTNGLLRTFHKLDCSNILRKILVTDRENHPFVYDGPLKYYLMFTSPSNYSIIPIIFVESN